MKRLAIFGILGAFVLALAIPMVAMAADPKPKDSRIKQKWDMEGTFTSTRTWAPSAAAWDFVPVGTTWNYSIHVKQAVDGSASAGSVHVWTTKPDGTPVGVVGHVEAVKTNYTYWYANPGNPNPLIKGQPNLAVAGRTNYYGAKRNFMLLYNNNAIHLATSDSSYAEPWAADSAWAGSLRTHDLLSTVVAANDFEVDPHVIR